MFNTPHMSSHKELNWMKCLRDCPFAMIGFLYLLHLKEQSACSLARTSVLFWYGSWHKHTFHSSCVPLALQSVCLSWHIKGPLHQLLCRVREQMSLFSTCRIRSLYALIFSFSFLLYTSAWLSALYDGAFGLLILTISKGRMVWNLKKQRNKTINKRHNNDTPWAEDQSSAGKKKNCFRSSNSNEWWLAKSTVIYNNNKDRSCSDTTENGEAALVITADSAKNHIKLRGLENENH